jgi:hypothetical protein
MALAKLSPVAGPRLVLAELCLLLLERTADQHGYKRDQHGDYRYIFQLLRQIIMLDKDPVDYFIDKPAAPQETG